MPLLLTCVLQGASQPPLSVLNSGTWRKLSVAQDGVYKINADLLKKMGIDPAKIDPRKIKIFTAGNGMLPQLNSATRQGNLKEIFIQVSGESDGSFDNGDQVLFFAKGPDVYEYEVASKIFKYENNLYTTKNFYFLTVDGYNGARILKKENTIGSFPLITVYDDFVFHETDQLNVLHSGREWYGEQVSAAPEMTIKFDITGIVHNSEIKIASQVMAQSFDQSTFHVFLNNVSIGDHLVDLIPNSQYGAKGRIATDSFNISASSVGAAARTSQEIKYQYVKNSSGKSIGYLDKFLMSFQRTLAVSSNQVIFSSAQSLEQPVSTFEISDAQGVEVVWEVTDPFTPAEQTFQFANNKISFSTESASLKTFVIYNPSNIPVPELAGTVANQNLTGLGAADLLIITHPDFVDEAARLADHRKNYSGLSVAVVTTDQVYNEFSGGKQDITAIRDLARYQYSKYPNVLKNLLLFGRCSYDYQDHLSNNTNFVPTYESKNSLSPLETYSSDDYFGFFDDTEGDWPENPAQNHTMEIGVGRISAKTTQEAADVVDKLIAYDLGKYAFGPWRKEILFVADDGDFNIHQQQADQLAMNIDTNHPELNTQKIYLDSFEQESKPTGQVSPDASAALRRALKKGVLITNYTGHGSEQVWMQEKILDEEFVATWKDFLTYPLLVTATCEFGRHDDPSQISSGELTQLKKNGGSIGLVTTARPVNSSTNFSLNKAFYEALFEKADGFYRDLGSVFRDTKNNSMSGVANRNFSLLGDPSMKLALPEEKIVVNSIKTSTNSDTLKALSKILIAGDIYSGEVKDTNFNGKATVALFDKEATINTRGDENPVFTYTLWNNALFRGEATVQSGTFQLEAMLPKNLAYQVGEGKLSLYAQDPTQKKDAGGSSTNFKVGESENSVAADIEPPAIKMFMGDTTFVAGGVVGPNTQLVAQLSDASGINISSYGIGNTLVAILDNKTQFELNDYYVAAKDDYTRGSLTYPLEGLEKGRHIITIKAWDNHNNPATDSLEFFVSQNSSIIIEELIAFPNPFNDNTTIRFSHSHPGEDLEASVVIYNNVGAVVQTMEFSIPESQYQVTLMDWDGSSPDGAKLGAGLYLLRVSVRSLLDGSKNEQITKLIILN